MRSVVEHSTKFIYYIKSIKWDKKAFQYIYKRDLKKEIKNEILYYKYYVDINN